MGFWLPPASDETTQAVRAFEDLLQALREARIKVFIGRKDNESDAVQLAVPEEALEGAKAIVAQHQDGIRSEVRLTGLTSEQVDVAAFASRPTRLAHQLNQGVRITHLQDPDFGIGLEPF